MQTIDSISQPTMRNPLEILESSLRIVPDIGRLSVAAERRAKVGGMCLLAVVNADKVEEMVSELLIEEPLPEGIGT